MWNPATVTAFLQHWGYFGESCLFIFFESPCSKKQRLHLPIQKGEASSCPTATAAKKGLELAGTQALSPQPSAEDRRGDEDRDSAGRTEEKEQHPA